MNLKTLATWGFLSALALGLTSCQEAVQDTRTTVTQQQDLTQRNIAGREYRFSDAEQRVIELTADEDAKAVYGVFSDIHGETKRLQVLVTEMQQRGAEAFIVLGDTPENDRLRSGGRQEEQRSDQSEMVEAFTILARSGLPVFVTVGNHETHQAYQNALREVSAAYPNLIDLVQYRSVDGDDVDLVSLPGYQIPAAGNRRFIPQDGYWASPEEISRMGTVQQGLDDAVVLVTHGPPEVGAIKSPGTIFSGKDVGDEATREMLLSTKIPFTLSGHIHEAGGIATTLYGVAVPENTFAEGFVLNVGSLEDWPLLDGTKSKGMAAIFTVEGKKAKYEVVRVGDGE